MNGFLGADLRNMFGQDPTWSILAPTNIPFSRIVEGELGRHDLKTKNRIKWLLDLEGTPFTKNDHYFASYREPTSHNTKRNARLVVCCTHAHRHRISNLNHRKENRAASRMPRKL